MKRQVGSTFMVERIVPRSHPLPLKVAVVVLGREA